MAGRAAARARALTVDSRPEVTASAGAAYTWSLAAGSSVTFRGDWSYRDEVWNDVANTPELYIKLRKNAGDTVTLDIIRDGNRMKMPVRTQRMYFRK